MVPEEAQKMATFVPPKGGLTYKCGQNNDINHP
jgi:hypothetical protein